MIVRDPMTAATAKWTGDPIPPIPAEVLRGIHWSYNNMFAAFRRHESSRKDAAGAWAAAVESVWWALTIDESLERAIGKNPYRASRNADRYGQVVDGLRWLRNRHAHEVVVTMSGPPARNFLDPPPGGIVYITRSLRWKPSEGIHAVDPRAKDAPGRTLQESYDLHVANRSVAATTDAAANWFRLVFTAFNIEPPAPAADPSELS